MPPNPETKDNEMPKIAKDAARHQYKFKGHVVTIPEVVRPGEPLTENIARFVNRQFATAIGNSLGSQITRLVDAAQVEENKKPEGERQTLGADYLATDEVQKMADELVTNYELGVNNRGSGGASGPRDPVQSIAENIAWERIKARLSASNFKINSVKAEKRRELITSLLEKDPSIMVQAKAAYESTAADAAVDGLDLSGLPEETPTADAPTTGEVSTPGTHGETSETGEATSQGEDTPAPGAFS